MLVKLDTFDTCILQRLTSDGRVSWRDLAEEIGLSLTPTLRRVRRLESEGYILGYTARLDEKRLVGAIEALVSITLDRQSDESLTQFEASVRDLSEVTDCFQITGEFDYLLRVVVLNMEHYQPIITKISRISVVSRISSSFVLKAVMRRGHAVTGG